jgi:hypothetical protein
MPPVSEAQRRAMRAAAAGKFTLGIPRKGGERVADKGGKLPVRKPQGGTAGEVSTSAAPAAGPMDGSWPI